MFIMCLVAENIEERERRLRFVLHMFYSVLDLENFENCLILVLIFGSNDWIALFPHVPDKETLVHKILGRLELLMDFDNLKLMLLQ